MLIFTILDLENLPQVSEEFVPVPSISHYWFAQLTYLIALRNTLSMWNMLLLIFRHSFIIYEWPFLLRKIFDCFEFREKLEEKQANWVIFQITYLSFFELFFKYISDPQKSFFSWGIFSFLYGNQGSYHKSVHKNCQG